MIDMKKTIFFPVLLVGCPVITAVIFQSFYTYFNLFLSVVLLGIALFSRNNTAASRMKYSALWLLILELLAFVLLLFGENLYQPPTVWTMYVLFVVLDVFVTPQITKEK